MVCGPAPAMLKAIVSVLGLTFAASMASRRVHSVPSHTPSPGSVLELTMKVLGAGGAVAVGVGVGPGGAVGVGDAPGQAVSWASLAFWIVFTGMTLLFWSRILRSGAG